VVKLAGDKQKSDENESQFFRLKAAKTETLWEISCK
jgi:hypothetical protein